MLEICNNFFQYLDSQNIRYCHWKSNGHLFEALTGETDLDILIHEDDQNRFNHSLEKYNFLEILSPPNKQFPYLEDYLGFDDSSGKLIHLHIHYKLISGQRFIKNHHLPLEELFFDNLVLKNNIYIPRPELELLLLIIRAGMKVEGVALIKHAIKDLTSPNSGYTAFPFGIEQEFKELIATSNSTKMLELLQQSQLPVSKEIFTEFIKKYQNQTLRSYDIFILNKQILWSLKSFRRDTSPIVFFKYYWLIFKNLNTIKRFFPAAKKTLAHKGFSLSIVGADGSGKSTLTEELHKWLSWKLSSNLYYYGIPKTLFVNFFNLSGRALEKVKAPLLKRYNDRFIWIYIAKKRFSISQQIIKIVDKKQLVITDRFPLNDFHSMEQPMDGPRLKNDKEKSNTFTSIEANYYLKISPPNHIFILQANLEELRKRKTDLDISTHKIKADAVNDIEENEKITLINANQPYSEVCLTVKRKIWLLLTETNKPKPQNATSL